jgi:hypothetical protein
VTGEGKRPLAAIVVAALLAALLAACGGSDSGSSDSTETAPSGSAASAQNGGAGSGALEKPRSGSKQSQGQDGSAGSKSKDRSNQSSGSPPKNVATPLEVSGGGSEQFRVKGGDNSVQEYGEESDESELQEVAEVVHDFYVARAEERWDEACSYLARSNVQQLEQLASQSPELKGAGCGPILKAFTRPLPASLQREVTSVDAGSFRREDEQGFLIYYGAGKTVYAMPLREEGGTWKVAALSGTALS